MEKLLSHLHSGINAQARADAAPPVSPYRWVIAAVLFAGVISAFFDRISISVLFTNVEFQNAMGTGFDPARLGLLMTAFLFAYGVSSIALSFVGDLFGPRRCLTVGALAWGGFMALMGAAGSFGGMLAYRVLLGLSEGPQFSLTALLTKRWFPSRERARATSLWMVGSPLGSMLGFPLTIHLMTAYGWRASFYLLAAINVFLILPLVVVFIRDRPETAPFKLEGREAPLAFRSSVVLFMMDWRFWMIVLATCGSLVYLWGLNSWLPSYLVRVRHFDPRQTSIFASLPFLCMFLGEILGAVIADRTGRSALVSAVSLFLCGFIMYFVPSAPDAYGAALLISASTFFWGACTTSKNALGLNILPTGAVATGVGLYNGIGNLVGALSPFVMGILIGKTENFEAGFLVIVASAILGSCALLPLAFAATAERDMPAVMATAPSGESA
jgi:sugar phosphate permease